MKHILIIMGGGGGKEEQLGSRSLLTVINWIGKLLGNAAVNQTGQPSIFSKICGLLTKYQVKM